MSYSEQLSTDGRLVFEGYDNQYSSEENITLEQLKDFRDKAIADWDELLEFHKDGFKIECAYCETYVLQEKVDSGVCTNCQ